MESKELAYYISELILEKKGENIKILALKEKTSITDYFVICSASADMQIKAIADNILKKTKDIGEKTFRNQGYTSLNWVLLDYIDVVVHIFNEETRKFYNLEGLWGDVEIIDIDENTFTKKKTKKSK